MIGQGAKIGEFIQQIQNVAQALIEGEFAMLLSERRKVQPAAKQIADYEQSYLSEQVRRSQFDFDSQSVRPYLPYSRVKQGVLDTASKLFQVIFRQEQGVPAWDPTVETWDVLDGGKMIGRIYLDMHPRPGKYSHAEMAPVRDGVRDKQLPEAILVCNFPRPTADDPGLMEYDEVVTFFQRIRPPDALGPGQAATMGRHQRHYYGVGFRQSAFPDAGGVDAQPAGAGDIRASLSKRGANSCRDGRSHEPSFRLWPRTLERHAERLHSYLL
jgi:hypothetical protein